MPKFIERVKKGLKNFQASREAAREREYTREEQRLKLAKVRAKRMKHEASIAKSQRTIRTQDNRDFQNSVLFGGSSMFGYQDHSPPPPPRERKKRKRR